MQEVYYILDMCYTVLQLKKGCLDAQELGKYAEKLLAEWRQEAVSHLRPSKDYKVQLSAEMMCRNPSLRKEEEETSCHNEKSDYQFYGLSDFAEQMFKMFQSKRQRLN